MRVDAVRFHSPAAAAMAAGLRGQMKTAQLGQALAAAGLLEPEMARSLGAAHAVTRATTEAGARMLALEPLGTLLDVLA